MCKMAAIKGSGKAWYELRRGAYKTHLVISALSESLMPWFQVGKFIKIILKTYDTFN